MNDQASRLRQLLNRVNISNKGTSVITVTSGKGGVGKSTFVANFAIELSKKGFKVLIIDADFGLSNIDIIFGMNPPFNLHHVITGQKTISEIIAKGPFNIGVISGGSGVYDLLRLESEQLKVLVSSLLKLENMADIIIFDTGAGISENILSLIKSSNETIIVITPEPTSLIDAYAMLKTVSLVDNSSRVRMVINKVESEKEAKETLHNFINVVKNYLKINIEELGFIMNDNNVIKSVKEQNPFVISYSASTASKNMENIVDTYLDISSNTNEKAGIKRFLELLFKK